MASEDSEVSCTPHRLRSLDGRLGMDLPPGQLDRMLELCRSAGGVETGGILVGHYSGNHAVAIVTDVSNAPGDSTHSRTRFRRGVRGLQQWINRLWRQSQGFYLGEWHFHPFASPQPSPCDLEQIEEIAGAPVYSCPEPLLVIIGGDPREAWGYRVFVFVGEKGLIELMPLDAGTTEEDWGPSKR